MCDPPLAVAQLVLLLAAARIAHEAIWGLRDDLVALARYGERQRERAARSGRIVSMELPELTCTARGMRALWSEHALLDPQAAEHTARELALELTNRPIRREPTLPKVGGPAYVCGCGGDAPHPSETSGFVRKRWQRVLLRGRGRPGRS
jgi:hypothetical protein